MSGHVALVGAGPGDPDLLTLRAEAVLAAAARVVTDAAVDELARRFAPGAEVVIVADGVPAVPAVLAAASRGDRNVVRLYAGDPWLHPAHGEELAALQEAGIATEAVAGVAIEVAVPALAGIALHVRHLAVVCTLGPAELVPPPVDGARTLVASCGDGAAAASQLVARGGDRHLDAAVLAIDGRSDAMWGALGDLAGPADPGDGDSAGGGVSGGAAQAGHGHHLTGATAEVAGRPGRRSLLVVGAVAARRSAEPAAGAEAAVASRDGRR